MTYQGLHEFEKCFYEKVIFSIKNNDELVDFKIRLRKCYYNFLEDIKEYCNTSASDFERLSYFKDMEAKSYAIKEGLFIKIDGEVRYRNKKSVIVEPVRENYLLSQVGNAQYKYLKRILRHLNKRMTLMQLDLTTDKIFSKEKSEKK